MRHEHGSGSFETPSWFMNVCIIQADVIRKVATLTLGETHDPNDSEGTCRTSKVTYQAFWGVLIDLIMEFLGLIIKPFDNQTKIWS